MSQMTFYKRASGFSAEEAYASLLARYPKARINLEIKAADKATAREAKVKVGELIYEATVRTSEFGEDEGGDDSDSDEEPKPKPKKKEEGGSSDSDSDGDEGGDGDGDDPFGDPAGLDGGLPKPKPEEQIVHLLTQILHALQGGGPGAGPGPDLAGGPAGPPPPKPMGAPKPGGPAGPGPGAPPPVAPKAPMGGPAFSHYNPEVAEIVTIRRDASEVGNKAMIAEAALAFPTHKVARIQRTGQAVLNGKTYDLPKNKIAVVHLVKK